MKKTLNEKNKTVRHAIRFNNYKKIMRQFLKKD